MASRVVDIDAHARLATRVSGAMMLAGAVVGAIAVALPPRAEGSDAIVVVLIAIAAVLGVVLLRSRQVLPEWLLGCAIAMGTCLATFATYEGGIDAGTDDNEMLYVWICLLSFNFLSLRHALGQLTLVGVAYALLLSDSPLGEAATRWTVSMATLLVAGLVFYRLRTSRERLVAELSEQVRTDGLTGLLNRTALEDRANLELARARRDGGPVALIVLDIDEFKAHNDRLGHPAGDQALRALAGSLRLETRQVDAVARLGGDEFGVLLPGTSIEEAATVGDRIMRGARALAGPGMTLSAGLAAESGSGTFEDLWQNADAAMYEAKRAGGDTIRTADEDVEPVVETALAG